MPILFYLSLMPEARLIFDSPLLQYLKSISQNRLMLVEWDNFSEPLLVQKATELLTEAEQFIVVTTAEPDSPIAHVLPFMQSLLRCQQKGYWFGQGNHPTLSKFSQKYMQERFFAFDFATKAQIPVLEQVINIYLS